MTHLPGRHSVSCINSTTTYSWHPGGAGSYKHRNMWNISYAIVTQTPTCGTNQQSKRCRNSRGCHTLAESAARPSGTTAKLQRNYNGYTAVLPSEQYHFVCSTQCGCHLQSLFECGYVETVCVFMLFRAGQCFHNKEVILTTAANCLCGMCEWLSVVRPCRETRVVSELLLRVLCEQCLLCLHNQLCGLDLRQCIWWGELPI